MFQLFMPHILGVTLDLLGPPSVVLYQNHLTKSVLIFVLMGQFMKIISFSVHPNVLFPCRILWRVFMCFFRLNFI